MLLGDLSCAVFDDEAIKHRLHDALFFEKQGGDGLEQQREAVALWPAFVRIEHQLIERHMQRQRNFLQSFQLRLRRAGLVAAYLVDVQPGQFGELDLGECLRFTQGRNQGQVEFSIADQPRGYRIAQAS